MTYPLVDPHLPPIVHSLFLKTRQKNPARFETNPVLGNLQGTWPFQHFVYHPLLDISGIAVLYYG
jgi:hypothetical protein